MANNPNDLIRIETSIAEKLATFFEAKLGTIPEDIAHKITEGDFTGAYALADSLDLTGLINDNREEFEKLALEAVLFGACEAVPLEETYLATDSVVPIEMYRAVDQLAVMIEMHAAEIVREDLRDTIQFAEQQVKEALHVSKGGTEDLYSSWNERRMDSFHFDLSLMSGTNSGLEQLFENAFKGSLQDRGFAYGHLPWQDRFGHGPATLQVPESIITPTPPLDTGTDHLQRTAFLYSKGGIGEPPQNAGEVIIGDKFTPAALQLDNSGPKSSEWSLQNIFKFDPDESRDADGKWTTAYHGSPNSFDKFSLKAIGSGEGNQTYGYGLYFAENPNVASEYKKAAGWRIYDRQGKELAKPDMGYTADGSEAAGRALYFANGDYDKAKAGILKTRENYKTSNSIVRDLDAQMATLENWKKAGATVGTGGSLYQVKIKVPANEMLDWDTPLSTQGKLGSKIAKYLLDHKIEGDSSNVEGVKLSHKVGDDVTGGQAVQLLEHHFGYIDNDPEDDDPDDKIDNSESQMKAAKLIKSYSARGVRYLDQFSREAKAGAKTHNYVVFDPDDVEITHKNGVAIAKNDTDNAFKAKWFELAVHSLPGHKFNTQTALGVAKDDVHKFDENEPRDSSGKWTSESGATEETEVEATKGKPIVVYRLGSEEGGIGGKNAGTLARVAAHIEQLNDWEKPNSAGGGGDTLTAYEVTLPEDLTEYSRSNGGIMQHNTDKVGREASKWRTGELAASYSFPKDFPAKKLFSVPLAAINKKLTDHGYHNDQGTAVTLAAMQEAVAEKTGTFKGKSKIPDAGSYAANPTSVADIAYTRPVFKPLPTEIWSAEGKGAYYVRPDATYAEKQAYVDYRLDQRKKDKGDDADLESLKWSFEGDPDLAKIFAEKTVKKEEVRDDAVAYLKHKYAAKKDDLSDGDLTSTGGMLGPNQSSFPQLASLNSRIKQKKRKIIEDVHKFDAEEPRDANGKWIDSNVEKKILELAKARPEATDAEQLAINNWKGDDFGVINHELRDNGRDTEDSKKIKSWLSRAALPSDTTLWRGHSGWKGWGVTMINKKPGDLVTDNGFVATSASEVRAKQWAGTSPIDIVVKINAKKGQHAALVARPNRALDDNEGEVLIQAGSTLKITNVDKVKRVVEADLVQPDDLKKTGEKNLYVHRPLLNTSALREWAKASGFKSTLPQDDLHVTLCYSKTPVIGAEPMTDTVTVEGGGRELKQFGDATVLHFTSPELSNRNHEFKLLGATSDFDSYKPHVTITYDGAPDDIHSVVPYTGPLVFGPEVHKPLKTSWADDLDESVLKLDRLFKADQAMMDLADKLNVATMTGKKLFDVAANVTTSRIISFGFLSQASKKGHTQYQINAILDDRTCPVCVYMNGKTFVVPHEYGKVLQALGTSDPKELKSIAPWPSQSKAGLVTLYAMTPAQLQAAGFGSPPFHPLCRCFLSNYGTVTETIPTGTLAHQVQQIIDGLSPENPQVVDQNVTATPDTNELTPAQQDVDELEDEAALGGAVADAELGAVSEPPIDTATPDLIDALKPTVSDEDELQHTVDDFVEMATNGDKAAQAAFQSAAEDIFNEKTFQRTQTMLDTGNYAEAGKAIASQGIDLNDFYKPGTGPSVADTTTLPANAPVPFITTTPPVTVGLPQDKIDFYLKASKLFTPEEGAFDDAIKTLPDKEFTSAVDAYFKQDWEKLDDILSNAGIDVTTLPVNTSAPVPPLAPVIPPVLKIPTSAQAFFTAAKSGDKDATKALQAMIDKLPPSKWADGLVAYANGNIDKFAQIIADAGIDFKAEADSYYADQYDKVMNGPSVISSVPAVPAKLTDYALAVYNDGYGKGFDAYLDASQQLSNISAADALEFEHLYTIKDFAGADAILVKHGIDIEAIAQNTYGFKATPVTTPASVAIVPKPYSTLVQGQNIQSPIIKDWLNGDGNAAKHIQKHIDAMTDPLEKSAAQTAFNLKDGEYLEQKFDKAGINPDLAPPKKTPAPKFKSVIKPTTLKNAIAGDIKAKKVFTDAITAIPDYAIQQKIIDILYAVPTYKGPPDWAGAKKALDDYHRGLFSTGGKNPVKSKKGILSADQMEKWLSSALNAKGNTGYNTYAESFATKPADYHNEQHVISDYQGSAYKPVNKYLLDGLSSPWSPDEYRLFDEAIRKSINPVDVRTYRGVRNWAKVLNVSSMAELKGLVGTEWLDKGYDSASTATKAALSFSGNGGAIIETVVPKGAMVLPMATAGGSDYEQEVVLPRDRKFKILKVEENVPYKDRNGYVDGYRTRIVMQMLNPNDEPDRKI